MSLRAWLSRLMVATSLAAGAVLAAGSVGAAEAVAGIDGRWQAEGRPGMVVEFTAGRYEAFDGGKSQERGSYTLEGDTITVVKDGEGPSHQGRFTREGDLLLIEPDDDDQAMLLRAENAAPAASLDPALVEGRWRTSDGHFLQFSGGRVEYRDTADADSELGTYRVEGNMLIVEEHPGAKPQRSYWARLGERLVLQSDDDEHKTLVLTPEPAAPVVQPAMGETSAILGRWVVKTGRILEIDADRFHIFENGEATFTGRYEPDGDAVLMEDGDKKLRVQFTRAGAALLLESDDGHAVLMFPETPGDAPPADPAAVEGRWRNDKDHGLELKGGHYARYGDAGAPDEGDYRVEGNTLVLTAPPGGEEHRLRWARFGDRLAVQAPDEDEAKLFALDAAAAASGPEGRWVMRPGSIVEIGDGKFTMSQNGALQLSGTYRVEGDTMIVASGAKEMRGKFTRAGDALLTEAEDGVSELLFLEAPSGTAPAPVPGDLEGRWVTAEGKTFEFADSHYALSAGSGAPSEAGQYHTEGNVLVMEPEGTGQVLRRHWAAFGARIALQVEDDERADVLTPAAAAVPDEAAPPAAEKPKPELPEQSAASPARRTGPQPNRRAAGD